MRQKIQDLWMLLKKDRKTQVIAGLLLAAVLYLAMADGGPKRMTVKNQKDKKHGAGAMGSNEAWGDLVTRFSTDLEAIKSLTTENKTELSEVKAKNKETEERTAEILKRILERMAETENTVLNSNSGGANNIDLGAMPGGSMGGVGGGTLQPDGSTIMPDGTVRTPDGRIIRPGGGGVASAASYGGGGDSEPAQLDSFGNVDGEIVAPPPVPEKEKLVVVGAGDSVRVKLLAGVNAPTDGTPYPVVFKLLSDVYGPDGSALPLGEARLIAAAQGSLTDSRALFRLSSLNLRMPDGRRKVIPVDGWVVGEDGIRGMEGVLIDPLGKAIMGAGIVGGLDGMGRSLASQQIETTTNAAGTTQIITGDEGLYAAGKAMSGAANQWSDLIRQRMELLVPHVEVLSGREATAVFSKSFVIRELYDQLAEDSQHFSSLD